MLRATNKDPEPPERDLLRQQLLKLIVKNETQRRDGRKAADK